MIYGNFGLTDVFGAETWQASGRDTNLVVWEGEQTTTKTKADTLRDDNQMGQPQRQPQQQQQPQRQEQGQLQLQRRLQRGCD
jgi:hypothetical protein